MNPATLPESSRRSEVAAEADFSLIRYAQCWEDTDVLVEALNVQPGEVCFSIASGGDNSIALLARAPARVIAVDLSPAQIALTELKAGAFRSLSYRETLEFAGIVDSTRRAELYGRVRANLAADAREFWDRRVDLIRKGVSGCGKFERYLGLFRRLILPLTHTRREIDALFIPRRPEERRRFYDEHWDNRRWRCLLRLFASRFVMGRLGRDPRFFRYVEGDVASRIIARAEHALAELDPASNPYLRWIVYGRFGDDLPYVWREENFDAIRRNLEGLELRVASVEAFLDAAAPRSIDAFNLSDIFEYLSEAASESVFDNIVRCARSSARVAYWNMMVPRQRPMRLAERLCALEEESRKLHHRAQTFFYGAFRVDEARAPSC
jgi:S-adenosylmethionine-diacylglycerol 3-amino-3-carboxypropyl transferase